MFSGTSPRKADRKLRRSAAIPLRLELWNGRAFDLANEPKVKIGVPSPSALRFLLPPDLMKLGQAYVEGIWA